MNGSFWTLDRVADALTGCSDVSLPRGPLTLKGISTDTRSVQAGDVFVALKGDRFDAHAFLVDAVKSGAAAVVVEHPERIGRLGVPQFIVRDTLEALGKLANYRRRAWGSGGSGKVVIGVAGSNGKTTTKDLITAALESTVEVHATSGNLNNLVGVPLTLLALPDFADVAVIEMGINVPGEMTRLRATAQPDIIVMTCVGEEHLEGLGSVEGVMREEALAFVGATIAVTPAAQPELASAARNVVTRAVTAGLDDGDFRASNWGLEDDGLGWIEVEGVTVRPPVRGAHNLRNAMLALAVARECGVSMERAARGISGMPAPAMRVAWENLGPVTVINDAYNANPGSMRAAIDLLERAGAGRPRVAVLGTMRELGPHSRRLHDEIARHALGSSFDIVAGIGEMADSLRTIANGDPRVITGGDVDEVWSQLKTRLAPNAVILLKASRGVKLERMMPIISAWSNENLEDQKGDA